LKHDYTVIAPHNAIICNRFAVPLLEVKQLRREAQDLKEVVAEQALGLRLLKKHDRGWGRPRMRYPSIIRLVEQSHLAVRRTLQKLGVARPTFYRWYAAYRAGGPERLEDDRPRPGQVWNRIPEDVGEAGPKLSRCCLQRSSKLPAVP
jgi:putative transposase